MTRRSALLTTIPLVLLIAACGHDRAVPEAALQESAPALRSKAEETRKLVKTVDLDLVVDDTTAASQKAQSLATELGGYVSAMSANRRAGLLYCSMTLRVPVARLDATVDRLKALARDIERLEMKSEDVTDQYVDLGARLKTLEATETELRQLLAESRQRQQKADDIMSIYAKLTEIRSGIEQIKGQLQSMENLTTLATIHVGLAPAESARPVVSDGWHPGQTVRNSARTLLAILRGLGDLLIGAVIVLGPLVAIVGGGAWIVMRFLRRGRVGNRD